MKKVYIVTWESNNQIGFDFNTSEFYLTLREAEEEIKSLSKEGIEYKIREVYEVFIYLANHLDFHELNIFTDDYDDLKQVFDFFENIKDEKLIERYLKEALYGEFYTYDRKEFIQREIDYLESLKK